MIMATPFSMPEPQLKDEDSSPVPVRTPNPKALARFDAALAAAPRALIEALEEAERLDRLDHESNR